MSLLRAFNPATGDLVREVLAHDDDQLAGRLTRSREAFDHWRRYAIPERAARLLRLAELLQLRRDELGALITLETGKPIDESRAELDKCRDLCTHFADEAPAYLASEHPPSGNGLTWELRCAPLGGVLAIMPWNFPVWQVLRCAAPALVAGNVVLLKHAPSVPGIAVALEQLALDAGFPDGTFTALHVAADDTDRTVARLIDDPAVAVVTLTGSVAAGRAVAARAGAALKKVVLELGGSDPLIALDDADPVAAARAAVSGRVRNAGQTCLAPKRWIVDHRIADAFADAAHAALAGLRPGDPRRESTDLGPLARQDLRLRLQRQIEASITAGAELRLGGYIPPGPGYWYPPTLLTGARPGMPVFDEETFGPLGAITVARDEDDAIELANATRFGLGASLWTADEARAGRLVARLQAGAVAVNTVVRSDPRVPFGGIKASGHGRELGRDGLRELINLQAVCR